MTSRERRLGLALLLVAASAAALCALALRRDDSANAIHAMAPKRAVFSEALAREFQKFRDAEAIEEPEARCLAYPDLQEFSWDPKVVKAFCHLWARQMITWSAINEALDKHNPELLQQTFDTYLERTYKRGQHGFLTWAFSWTFQNDAPETLQTATKWVDEDPQSGYARAARGMHYVAAAYSARGGEFVRDTPSEKLDRMHDFADKAKSDLEESLRLNPRVIAAYHGLLRIAQLTGDDELRKSSVKQALALDPADQWVYDDWMDAVEPKWGGSMQEMQRVADASASHAGSNPLLSRARGRPLCYVAQQTTCEQCEPADHLKVLEMYRESAAFGPSACFLKGAGEAAENAGELDAALRYYSQGIRLLGNDDLRVRRADLLHRFGRTDLALEDFGKAVARNPRNTYALDHQAYILELSGRAGEAEQSYLALQLSRLYLSKLASPDKAEPLIAALLERNPKLARAWLYKAALAKGKDEAACREGLENYLKYVDRNNVYERQDIAQAQARLDQLKHKT